MEKKETEVVEAVEEVGLYPLVEDSSCLLVFKTHNFWTNQSPDLPDIRFPYAHAKALHDHLSQYSVRQQVFDAEFRNPPE